MVKKAAAAFAFLALFGTPVAAQFADAEEAKSWFFLQRIARDLGDIAQVLLPPLTATAA
jgi:hypothetical protein